MPRALVSMTVRLPPEVRAWLERQGRTEARSMNGVIVKALADKAGHELDHIAAAAADDEERGD